MQRADFNTVVDNALQCFRGYGIPDLYLAAKLKHLKECLKKWRLTSFSKEKIELYPIKKLVNSLDMAAESRTLTSVEMNQHKDGNQKIIELEKWATLDLKQKSRIRWTVDGDKNTCLFHGHVNNNNRKNTIYGLTINGAWSTDVQEIMGEAFRFFEQKFKERWPKRPKLISNQFMTLSEEDSGNLEKPFTLEEIKSAIWACGNEKAPMPGWFYFQIHQKSVGNA
ncbi:uncharacterized protein LOC111912315 [Lactuca sativa]|uniref:uncharacterized protein LOC111912315 n=1 Tax=Lactuca sativa TaxID=4236 RepID=UPI000CD84BC5|nr:uncharacterized protein LOC111912315 [Lactuca sativa]